MANVVVSALATWNGKALKKAKQDVNVFDKQLKSLGRTFGVTFSAAAVVAFSKKAIKAFAEDEAAAKSLALQLENTGNAFRVNEVETYIKRLEKTYSILTDLRSPFQTLLNVTQSVDLAQRSLEAALNISAGTGENLNTVVNAIAAGVRGQTKAIQGLNTGIDQSIIKTGDMNKIMAALEQKFSGQAAARLDTYSGKMDTLKKSADEATKSIGRGLVDALTILSKDQSISNLATDFENLGDNIAYAIVQMARLTSKISDLVGNPSFKAALLALAIFSKNPKAVVGAMSIIGLSAVGGALTSARKVSPEENAALARARLLNRRLEAQLIKLSAGARKTEYDLIVKKTALDKLKDQFDLERIGLTKALNEATDAETKLRLQSQLAILDNNEALAKKYLAELEAARALKELEEAARKAAAAWGTFDPSRFRRGEEASMDSLTVLMALAALGGGAKGLAGISGPISGGGGITGTLGGSVFNPSLVRAGESKDLTITIDTTATGDRFAALIAESLQIAQKSGVSYGIAGGL